MPRVHSAPVAEAKRLIQTKVHRATKRIQELRGRAKSLGITLERGYRVAEEDASV
ncbi:MAG: hypothetical protein K8R88_07130 [Armatimonadetes bacterium]|nr:hypothetical protein [Armatimonadota bacterium]